LRGVDGNRCELARAEADVELVFENWSYPRRTINELDAYNARDIGAFMEWWSDDCEYYEFPARLLASGAAEVRERHVARFKEPNLFGKLIRRSVVDNLVVDQEVVTRTFTDGIGEVDVLAIYQIEHGKIAKA
jgi:hypothetical protein